MGETFRFKTLCGSEQQVEKQMPELEGAVDRADTISRTKYFGVGAGVGGTLGLLLTVLSRGALDGVLPISIGIVVGGFYGLALSGVRKTPNRWFFRVLAWGYFWALTPVLGLCALLFFAKWATGAGEVGYPLRGTGRETRPFSFAAAANALDTVVLAATYLLWLLLGIALVGGTAGITLGFVVGIQREDVGNDSENPQQ